MMKCKKQFNDNAVRVIDLLSQKSLENLFKITGRQYTRVKVKETIKVERVEKDTSFWKKMMTQKTGVNT